MIMDDKMQIHVSGDLCQIGESVSGTDGWCEAVRVYVLLNDGRPLIFDAGSHLHTDPIMTGLKSLLGDMEPAYVFLTHTELPHTGNMSAIAKAWPNIEFVVSSGILPHVELPWWVKPESVQYGYPGTDEVFAGRRISFLDAMLKDQPGTHWMYDHQTETLFTADAFGYLFPMSADQQLDDDLEDGIPADWLRRYHEAAFRFLKLSSGDHVIADFDRVFSKRDVSVIAPTHGNAIRGDVAQCRKRFNDVMRELCR